MSKALPANSPPSVDAQTWMRAVDEGDTSLIGFMLAAGVNVNTVSDRGETALMRATARGYSDVVRVLLDAGADVNVEKDNGSTALSMAAFYGYADIVSALLAKGADSTARTPVGASIEKRAPAAGLTEILKLLRNVDFIDVHDSSEGRAAMTTSKRSAGAAEFFPTAGTFRPVVPLSEINEAATVEFTPPVAASSAPLAEKVAARIEHRRVSRGDNNRRVAPAEEDEVTLVPPRIRSSHLPHTPFIGHQKKDSLLSWRVIVLCFALMLVVGMIASTVWMNSRQSAKTQHSAPIAEGEPPVADVKTQALQPQAAIGAANSQPLQPAPRISNSRLPAVPESETILRAPVTASSVLDETEAKAGKARGTRQKASAGREKSDAETSVVRQDIRSVRPVQRTPDQIPTPASQDLSSTVFSPTPSDKSKKSKVIQWP